MLLLFPSPIFSLIYPYVIQSSDTLVKMITNQHVQWFIDSHGSDARNIITKLLEIGVSTDILTSEQLQFMDL